MSERQQNRKTKEEKDNRTDVVSTPSFTVIILSSIASVFSFNMLREVFKKKSGYFPHLLDPPTLLPKV